MAEKQKASLQLIFGPAEGSFLNGEYFEPIYKHRSPLYRISCNAMVYYTTTPSDSVKNGEDLVLGVVMAVLELLKSRDRLE